MNDIVPKRVVLEGELVIDELAPITLENIFYNIGKDIMNGYVSGLDNSIEADYRVILENPMAISKFSDFRIVDIVLLSDGK